MITLKAHNKSQGFTLLEILVTVLLFGMLSALASSSLFSLLRGASNTNVVRELKQNGDYALSVMEVKIRNANSIAACTGLPSNTFTIANPGSIPAPTTTYTCINGTIQTQDGAGVPGNLLSSSVTISNCQIFTCTTVNGIPHSVLIQFSLSPTAQASVPQTESFRSQVNLRNK
jgi:prepilin-type N-terminal cleavage/methylation domain-containing protein